MMSPCMIAIIFLLIVLYFTYEPGSLPFLGGAGHEDKGKDKKKEVKKDPAIQDAQDTIDDFDDDGDGKLNKDEYEDFRFENTPPTFDIADEDDDGMIDAAEMKEMNEAMHTGGDFIGGEDEYDDLEEIHNQMHEDMHNRDVNNQFDEHDVDGDGMISRDEFTAAHTGGGGCSSGHSDDDEKKVTGGGGNYHHDDEEHHKKMGGAMWGGLEAFDDSSGFASF